MSAATRYGPAGILLLGCLLLLSVKPQNSAALLSPLTSLPSSFMDYHGVEQTIPDDELRIAGVSEYVARQFFRDSLPAFSLYVGYYDFQTQGKTIHSPRNCLPGSGWRTLRAGIDTLRSESEVFVVNKYLLTDGRQQALVYYWYQGRGRVAANEYLVKWDLLRDAAFRGRTEEALVRIVVPISASVARGGLVPDAEAAGTLAATVARSLIPAVDAVLPTWGPGIQRRKQAEGLVALAHSNGGPDRTD